ncbi:ABC transporter permease [Vagococcus vulneris]|uniref:Uncharacterized protein n=1 Tax=Vagococcus vulneris TaxID=1977869 RepID=A0A429ZXY8_9ENTE|nr:ABC transporter permease [Vagococcus vulneris]RST98765.1 hypothetical protein CBF37_06880 [Vagococcus vulneris]
MTGMLIFKGEFFKYKRDRKYIVTTIGLAVLNIIATVYFTYLIDHINRQTSQIGDMVNGIFITFFTFCIIANFVFLFFYPFHLMAMDYKNNVMPLLMASGVNRTKLFFSKLGATFIWVVCLSIFLVLIPGLIVLFRLSQDVGFIKVYEVIMDFFQLNNLNFLELSGIFILEYINSLAIISLSTILMKGRNLAILLYFIFRMVESLFLGSIKLSVLNMNLNQTGMLISSNLALILSILIISLISLYAMKKQNL